MTEDKRIIIRIALLYRDLLSSTIKPLSDNDKQTLLNIQPPNKIVAIGDIDYSNWNAYPLTYLLDRKFVAPTVLDESKIYQSVQAMRTCNKSIIHPQNLISQSVVIRILGLDNSANINDHINTFLNMCLAADECQIIFIIFDGDKRFYKSNIYTRKTNSSFIDISSSDKRPYTIESSPLCISPDQIVYFNHSKKNNKVTHNAKAQSVSVVSTISSRKKNNCSSMFSDPDMF